jgi:hypothetical protein
MPFCRFILHNPEISPKIRAYKPIGAWCVADNRSKMGLKKKGDNLKMAKAVKKEEPKKAAPKKDTKKAPAKKK